MKKTWLSLLLFPVVAMSLSGCSVGCEHTWDDGTMVTKPTFSEAGVVRYTCTKCGETKDLTTQKLVAVTPTWSGATTVAYDGKKHGVTLDFGEYSEGISVVYYYNGTQCDGVSSIYRDNGAICAYKVDAVVTNNNPYVYLEKTTYTLEGGFTITKGLANVANVRVEKATVYWTCSSAVQTVVVKVVDCNSKSYEKEVSNANGYVPLSEISTSIYPGNLTAYVKANDTDYVTGGDYVASEVYNYEKWHQDSISSTADIRLESSVMGSSKDRSTSTALAIQPRAYKDDGYVTATITYSISFLQDKAIPIYENAKISYCVVSGDATTALFNTTCSITGAGSISPATVSGKNSVDVSIDQLLNYSALRIYFQNTSTTRGGNIKGYSLSITYYR